MNNLFDINDRVVVITGGTGILGHAISKYLAQQGAKIVLLDRREEEGLERVKEIEDEGGDAMFLITDVLNKATLEKNLEDILARYGRIDVLLNAAGGNMPGATIAPDATFFDLSPEAFEKVLNLNLVGTVLPTGIPPSNGRGRQGRDSQLLVDVGIPPTHKSGRIWRSKGRGE